MADDAVLGFVEFERARVSDGEDQVGDPPLLFVGAPREGTHGAGGEHAGEGEPVAGCDRGPAGGGVLAEDGAVCAGVVEVGRVVEGAFEMEIALVLVVEKFDETLGAKHFFFFAFSKK